MATPQPVVGGGMNAKVVEEIQVMSGHILLVILVLVSVYVSRIPESILVRFKTTFYKIGGLLAIVLLTTCYGWVHGIVAALAFALVMSRANRHGEEGFTEYVPGLASETTIIPTEQRWLSEKILGEVPYKINEKNVNTSAIQDVSEKSMTNSYSSR